MKVWLVQTDDMKCCCSTKVVGIFTTAEDADKAARESKGWEEEYEVQ